ncbi:MAG: P1 family peptidase [Evtepia sp.]
MTSSSGPWTCAPTGPWATPPREAALQGGPLQEGNFGAGTGCTVGKIRGAKFAMKGGIGCCAYRQGNLMVGAVVACNAMGDVWDHGQIIAGARNDENTGFANSEEWLIAHVGAAAGCVQREVRGQNTVIGCVVTNAALTKPQTAKLAAVAQNGIARAVRPANATFDGDSIVRRWPCGSVPADPDAVGILAARAVEEAICRGVRAAESLHGRPAIRDLPFGKDKNS